MTEDEYILLYEKYKTGQCSPQEIEMLMANDNDFGLKETDWNETIHGNREALHRQIYRQLNQSMRPVAKVRFLTWARLAAAMILLFGLSVGIYQRLHPQKLLRAAVVKPYANDVLPGGNKAILRLSSGAVIVLTNAKNGLIAKEGNVNVKKTTNGQLVYDVNGTANSKTADINTVSVPKGGQYQLLLPDGSKVWLNAASSISFPAAFTGKERNVKLTGEAYFEVAHNKDMPFIVSVNKLKVQVLGTHFNIMAYNDEGSFRTTLLEGSVRLSNGTSQTSLKPGQQGIFERVKGQLVVANVNTADAVAWKNGYFVFDHEDINQVMRKISRWYDVDVDYDKDIPDDQFAGSVNRFVKVSKVLQTLEMTGEVHFKINGRRITVTR